jgi:hypothetical protein
MNWNAGFVIARSQRVRANARPDDRLRDEAIQIFVSARILDCFFRLRARRFGGLLPGEARAASVDGRSQ